MQELASKTGTREWNWLAKRKSLHQLREFVCVFKKGGTGLFVGGDPTCLPRKGTAHCFKSRVTWEVIRKALLNPVRIVKE